MNLSDAFGQWSADIKPAVIAEYGADDAVALSESWNDYTDALCKDGDLCALQYHFCPAFDEPMPDDDPGFILESMGVDMTSRRVDQRPTIVEWPAEASHWIVTIQYRGIVVSTYFSMGSARLGEPELADVMSCLLFDADAADQTFDDWCADFGYDTDSRKAFATYDACAQTARGLNSMFTPAELAQLRELFADY